MTPKSPEILPPPPAPASPKKFPSQVPVIKGSVTPKARTPKSGDVNPFFASAKEEPIKFFGVSLSVEAAPRSRSPVSVASSANNGSSSSSSASSSSSSPSSEEDDEDLVIVESSSNGSKLPMSPIHYRSSEKSFSIGSIEELDEGVDEDTTVVSNGVGTKMNSTIVKQDAISLDDGVYDVLNGKSPHRGSNGRRKEQREEEDREMIMKTTEDYVTKVFDSTHESQVLDSLERECLENLASLQMTWKSCSVDDIESIKDILSPP